MVALAAALTATAAQAVTPDAKTKDALDVLVMGQLASKACTNLRLNFAGMTAAISAAGLRASDATHLYGSTVGELGDLYSKAAHDDLDGFCATAWTQLGPDGTRAHMLERTDKGQ